MLRAITMLLVLQPTVNSYLEPRSDNLKAPRSLFGDTGQPSDSLIKKPSSPQRTVMGPSDRNFN